MVNNDHNYKAFGLVINSDFIKLPELIKSSDNKKPDIRIIEDNYKEWPTIPPSNYNTNFVEFSKNEARITVENLCKFRILNGEKIYFSKTNPKSNDKDIRAFLLGSAIGAALIQRDITVLHANALVKNNATIVCLGVGGAGKSTFSYSLIRNGWKLLGDDLITINSNFEVLPGIPRLKLWADSMNAFELKPNLFENVRGKLKKYLIPRDYINFELEPKPLKSIFFIERDRFNQIYNNKTNIQTENISSEIQTLIRLRNNLYRPRFVRGLGKENKVFKFLAYLQRSIPANTLQLPGEIKKMDKMLKDFHLKINEKI